MLSRREQEGRQSAVATLAAVLLLAGSCGEDQNLDNPPPTCLAALECAVTHCTAGPSPGRGKAPPPPPPFPPTLSLSCLSACAQVVAPAERALAEAVAECGDKHCQHCASDPHARCLSNCLWEECPEHLAACGAGLTAGNRGCGGGLLCVEHAFMDERVDQAIGCLRQVLPAVRSELTSVVQCLQLSNTGGANCTSKVEACACDRDGPLPAFGESCLQSMFCETSTPCARELCLDGLAASSRALAQSYLSCVDANCAGCQLSECIGCAQDACPAETVACFFDICSADHDLPPNSNCAAALSCVGACLSDFDGCCVSKCLASLNDLERERFARFMECAATKCQCLGPDMIDCATNCAPCTCAGLVQP